MDSNFLKWSERGTLTSVNELRAKCGITRDELMQYNNIVKFLCYIEYVVNMIFSFYGDLMIAILDTQVLNTLEENIKIVLGKINYEYIAQEGKWIIVEKNPSATVVAEIIKDTKVIEYNHYLLKGDVKGKRDILKLLANKFEEAKPNLIKIGYKDLADDMGYLFNNLGIRHPKDDLIKDMKPKELEEWYDRTYDMFLLCILANNHVNIRKDIKKLKTPEQAS